MSGFVLDTGALFGYERDQRRPVTVIQGAKTRGERVAVPAGVVAQAWRDGSRQAVLAQLLKSQVVDTLPLDDVEARLAGQLCGLIAQPTSSAPASWSRRSGCEPRS